VPLIALPLVRPGHWKFVTPTYLSHREILFLYLTFILTV
jgi:hypothetical protein